MQKISKLMLAILLLVNMLVPILAENKHVYTPTNIDIAVECDEYGGTVELYDESGTKLQEINISDKSSGKFTVSIEEPDTYLYTIRQASVANGVTKDTSVYAVSVYVYGDASLKLTPHFVVKKGTEKTEKVLFHNTKPEEPKKEEPKKEEPKSTTPPNPQPPKPDSTTDSTPPEPQTVQERIQTIFTSPTGDRPLWPYLVVCAAGVAVAAAVIIKKKK